MTSWIKSIINAGAVQKAREDAGKDGTAEFLTQANLALKKEAETTTVAAKGESALAPDSTKKHATGSRLKIEFESESSTSQSGTTNMGSSNTQARNKYDRVEKIAEKREAFEKASISLQKNKNKIRNWRHLGAFLVFGTVFAYGTADTNSNWRVIPGTVKVAYFLVEIYLYFPVEIYLYFLVEIYL